MTTARTAYISLGGNMGGEEALFARALEKIGSWPGVAVLAASRVYRTEPQGDPGQPWFRNQVAALSCAARMEPRDLLARLLALETDLGRERDPERRFGPRRIDLDLLLMDDIVKNDPFVTLPHPRMKERAFVLVPLLEIAPGLVFPNGQKAAEILTGMAHRIDGDSIHQPSGTQGYRMAIESPSKTLGVLSGMGPAAGAEFLRLLTAKAPAERDQEHPIVYMLSDPSISDRTAAMFGTGPDPTEHLRKDLMLVAGWGVDFLAVPCNTAHIFIDRFRDELPVPLIHIVEATVGNCVKQSPKGAWLLATEATCKSGLYQQYAKKIGYTFREVTPEVQQEVTRALTLVKAGKMAESGQCMRDVVEKLWKIEDLGIATACTELPLAYDASGLPEERSVSSLGALSDACLRAIYGPLYTR